MSVNQSTSTGTAPSTGHSLAGATRGPGVTWLLSVVTFGIYFYVWYYKVNRELRDFDSSIQVKPGGAVCTIMFGWILIGIPPIVSMVKTGNRISQAQRIAGVQESCSGGVGFLLSLLFGLNVAYYQSHLNKVWAVYGSPAEGTALSR
jgi:hypothetical protein